MKKEIREVKDGIVQITTVDERWYVKAIKDEQGIPKVVFVPSVTWIAGHYIKEVQTLCRHRSERITLRAYVGVNIEQAKMSHQHVFGAVA